MHNVGREIKVVDREYLFFFVVHHSIQLAAFKMNERKTYRQKLIGKRAIWRYRYKKDHEIGCLQKAESAELWDGKNVLHVEQ